MQTSRSSTVRPIRRAATGVLAAAWAALGACSGGDDASQAARVGAASLDALGTEVVAAFVASDTARLRRLRVPVREYTETVYPRLAEAHPGSVLPREVSVRNFALRDGRAWRRYLDRMRGLPLRAVETRCDGPTRRYGDLTVLNGCEVTVADGRGARGAMPIFRQVVVKDGGYRALRLDD